MMHRAGYRNSRSAKPLHAALSSWITSRDWATSAIAVSTVALECVLVPFTLFKPPWWRTMIGLHVMVAMHVGIAVTMSAHVGFAFLTVLPSYALGFHSSPYSDGALVGAADGAGAESGSMVEMWSAGWWCAVAVGLLPSAFAACRGHLTTKVNETAGEK